MGPKRKVKYESLTIRQAQHKNSAEDAQLEVVMKFLRQEQAYAEMEQTKERGRVHEALTTLCRTRPVECFTLDRFHVEQRKNIRDVCAHICGCYMSRQERNQERWRRRWQSQGSDRLPPEPPVPQADNLLFILRAFPDIYQYTVGYDLSYNSASKVDIYQHSRAGHDMKCMSTRSKPVGQYNHRGPVNFRFWDRDTQTEEDSRATPSLSPNGQRKQSFINVTGRRLTMVDKNKNEVEEGEGEVKLPPVRKRRNSICPSEPTVTKPVQGGKVGIPESEVNLPPMHKRRNSICPSPPTATKRDPEGEVKLPPIHKRQNSVFPSVPTATKPVQPAGILQNSNERQMERLRKTTQLLVQGLTDGRILTEKERRARFERIICPSTPTPLPPVLTRPPPKSKRPHGHAVKLPPVVELPAVC